MLLEFGERVDVLPSPFLPLWFRVQPLSGPPVPQSCANWGPSMLAGRASLPRGAGQTPGQWAQGEVGAPGTGTSTVTRLLSHWGGCLAPILVG